MSMTEDMTAACGADCLPSGQSCSFVFDCQGIELVVRTGPGEVALYLSGRYLVLPQVRTASGTRYEGEGLLLWMKGDEALFAIDGTRYSDSQRTPVLMPEVTIVVYT
jgi:membrane-bound inhibitor of C-type lysozyme